MSRIGSRAGRGGRGTGLSRDPRIKELYIGHMKSCVISNINLQLK